MTMKGRGEIGPLLHGQLQNGRSLRRHRREELIVHRLDSGVVEVAAQKSDLLAAHRMEPFYLRPIADRSVTPGALSPEAEVQFVHADQHAGFKTRDAIGIAGWDDQIG